MLTGEGDILTPERQSGVVAGEHVGLTGWNRKSWPPRQAGTGPGNQSNIQHSRPITLARTSADLRTVGSSSLTDWARGRKDWPGRAGLELELVEQQQPGGSSSARPQSRSAHRGETGGGLAALQSYTVTDNGVEKCTILYEWNE